MGEADDELDLAWSPDKGDLYPPPRSMRATDDPGRTGRAFDFFRSKHRVARASAAGAVSLMAMATIRHVAEELRRTGRFDTLAPDRRPTPEPLFADLA
jgi:hypothetical protein